jgi:hypothetical protein
MRDPQRTPDAGDFEPREPRIVRHETFMAGVGVSISTFESGSRILNFNNPSSQFQLHFTPEQWERLVGELVREMEER